MLPCLSRVLKGLRGLPPRALTRGDPGLRASRCEMEAWGGPGECHGGSDRLQSQVLAEAPAPPGPGL